MATPAKKQSFLGGAAILAAAVVIVKLIGAAYKIPLSNILGSAGQTYFDTAYQIYNFLLTFSTAGLPRRCCGKRCRRIFTDPSGLWTAPWRETSLKANSCRP